MQCVILAGGLGQRMRPMTEMIPKALMPVHGRPFADYQLTWLARQSIDRVVFCIGYRGEQIARHFGDGAAWGLQVQYSDEGDKLRGTAGALRVALDAGLLSKAFYVLYGDSFLPIEFPPVFQDFLNSQRPALMSVMRNENRWDRSNVIFSRPLVTLYDKFCDEITRRRMTHIDYGLSVVSRDLIETKVPRGEVVDLGNIFKDLSLANELAGHEVTERFYEVGSAAGLADFSRYVQESGLLPSNPIEVRTPRIGSRRLFDRPR